MELSRGLGDVYKRQVVSCVGPCASNFSLGRSSSARSVMFSFIGEFNEFRKFNEFRLCSFKVLD